MSQESNMEQYDATTLNSINGEFGKVDFSTYDEELSVIEVINLLTAIWNVSQTVRNPSIDIIDDRTACYWLLRVMLMINLESEEIDNLLNGQIESPEESQEENVSDKELLGLQFTPNLGRFYCSLRPVYGHDDQHTKTNVLTIPNDLFITALRAVIRLADSGYFRPLNEETVNGIVIIAKAASTMDLRKFPPKHTSEMVAELAERCVTLHKGSFHLGLSRGALKIIFEKMGRELSLKGSAMFVKAVNNDNPFYSATHNTLLAKLVQPWSYWARRRRREESLNAHELYLLSFILSQTVPKTALVNVVQSRVEVMESIKLYLEEQALLRWMLYRSGRIRQAAAKCDLPFSEVQFLMFNHIIYGWCSGYGAGVNFNWNSTGERQLLWQHFDLETLKIMLDVSVNYIQDRNWKAEFGVSRLQFARSTLECIVGTFRHVDLFNIQPAKYAFQKRIVAWIEKIITAITPNSRDPSFMLTLREISSIAAAMSSTKRALHANGYLPFENANDLNRQIEAILQQQLISAIEFSEKTLQEVQDCFDILDDCVTNNTALTINVASNLARLMVTNDLYRANLLVEELVMRTVKSFFVATDLLVQLINAGRQDLATIWLFVLKRMLETYSAFLGSDSIWTELSTTEQEVLKRNALIALTIIDNVLGNQENGFAFFHSKAVELGIAPEDQSISCATSELATLRWLSPTLEQTIRNEVAKYQPTYGEQSASIYKNDPLPSYTTHRVQSREKGTFTNSFESQVHGYVKDYLEKLKDRGTIKSYALRPNIRVFYCEIDLVVEIIRNDNCRIIRLIECEGESWHSTFGVRNPLDVTKTKVKTSPVLWKMVGVTEVPRIVAISHREFKSRRGTEQRSYVESLLSDWLS